MHGTVSRPASGSSPRVRGTPKSSTVRRWIPRFIPACAGNSTIAVSASCRIAGSSPRVRGTRRAAGRSSPSPAVHPRVCGELAAKLGKAPDGVRFIPACAGNSTAVLSRASDLAGSSPRVRGTRAVVVGSRRPIRFIPACAGNSAATAAPRAGNAGSSPRVRGTRSAKGTPAIRRRFIPACAGNSQRRRAQPSVPAVHPRVCGELRDTRYRWLRYSGSSPRVRGTPEHLELNATPLRFIPACAGNSCATPPQSGTPSVHPRVCGELIAGNPRAFLVDGSSPRVRGTLCSAMPCRRACRFIPACAGNSKVWPAAGGS